MIQEGIIAKDWITVMSFNGQIAQIVLIDASSSYAGKHIEFFDLRDMYEIAQDVGGVDINHFVWQALFVISVIALLSNYRFNNRSNAIASYLIFMLLILSITDLANCNWPITVLSLLILVAPSGVISRSRKSVKYIFRLIRVVSIAYIAIACLWMLDKTELDANRYTEQYKKTVIENSIDAIIFENINLEFSSTRSKCEK